MDIISLGHNCSVAAMMSKAGLVITNKSAFGNMFSSDLKKFNDFIAANGSGFFELKNIERLNEWEKVPVSYTFRDNKTGIVSVHDCPLIMGKNEAIAHMLKKKKPLIEDFFEIIKNSEELLLIRSNVKTTELEESVRLHDVISDMRSGKKFSLCVFQNRPFADKEWGIESLEFYRSTTPSHETNRWLYSDSWIFGVRSMCLKHGLQDVTLGMKYKSIKLA
jgi:hypothetical protein